MFRSADPPGNRLHAWSDQQAVLAEFGLVALRGGDLDAILQRACELVARGLRVPIAKVLEALPGRDELLLRAAVGVPPEVANTGKTTVPGGRGSAAGYIMLADEPVISHVPPDQFGEIFREFHRSHKKTHRAIEGFGIGLAVVDRLTDLLGHRIEVSSTPGKGTVFRIEGLPWREHLQTDRSMAPQETERRTVGDHDRQELSRG